MKFLLPFLLAAAVLSPASILGQGAPRWSPPAALNSYAQVDGGSDDLSARIATDNNNRWVSVWRGTRGCYAATSNNNGATWSPAQTLKSSPDENFHPDAALPVSVVYAGNLTYVAVWTEEAGTFISRSVDNGNTWSDAEGSPTDGLLDADSDGKGTVIIASYAGLCISKDFGVTWSTIDDQNAASPRRICYRGNNKWFLSTWQNGYYLTTSTDNGQTWSEPQRFNGIMLDIAGNNDTLVVASHSAPDVDIYKMVNVYFHYSKDGGASWQQTPHLDSLATRFALTEDVSLDVNALGTWVFVTERSNTIATMQATDPAGPWTTLTSRTPQIPAGKRNPALAIDDTGRIVTAYTVLPEDGFYPRDSDVQTLHSTNSGASWSQPVYINSYANSDLPALNDSDVAIAFGEQGRALAIWDSSILGVMISRSLDSGRTWSEAVPIPFPEAFSNTRQADRNKRDSLNLDREIRPFLTYRGGNEWYAVVSAYDTSSPGNKRIVPMVSYNHGNSWTVHSSINATVIGASSHTGTLIKTSEAGYNPSTFDVARLSKNSTTWITSAVIPHRPSHVVQTVDNEWMLLTWDSHLYISQDDGVSWQESPVVNAPSVNADIKADGQGVVVAVWNDGEWGNHEQGGLPNFVSRSLDSGRTWSSPQILADNQYNLYGFRSIRVTSADDSKWIAVWNSSPTKSHKGLDLLCAVSYDDGATWSNPHPCPLEQLYPSYNYMYLSSIAGHSGRVMVSWDQDLSTVGPFFPDNYGYDQDLFYSTAYLSGAPAGSTDWQLFE